MSLAALALPVSSAFAQDTAAKPASTPPMSEMSHDGHEMSGMDRMDMKSSIDLLSPMSQEASGTAWLPSSSPMYGRMWMKPDGSMLMLHGAITPRYTDTASKRGDHKIDAPNWVMGMYSHPLGSRDQIGLRAMMSLDALTEWGSGYPLLFQSGESWRGSPLHDHQHPHDLFSELSVDYSHLLSKQASAYLYVGYPGEPALGPPTFMHRLIAFDLADAPIGHHWQDGTHITWGVATAGMNLSNTIKLEAGLFNGREPDENRYTPDNLHLDSHAGRISFNPDANNAFQLSYGFQKNPEGDGVNQHRTTASWIYNRPLRARKGDANFTTTLVWGQNLLADAEGRSNSYLAEADYQVGSDTVFGRIEQVQKSGHELVLPGAAVQDRLFGVGAYTVGYVRDLTHGRGIDTGVGSAVTLNTKPASLDPYYGDGSPVGFQIFFRLRPSRIRMDERGMSGMQERAGDEKPAGPLKIAAALGTEAPQARQTVPLTVTLTDADGHPVRGATVRATVNMQAMDMGTQRPAFRELENGRYETDLAFAMAGKWRVVVTATRGDGKDRSTRTFDFGVGAAR